MAGCIYERGRIGEVEGGLSDLRIYVRRQRHTHLTFIDQGTRYQGKTPWGELKADLCEGAFHRCTALQTEDLIRRISRSRDAFINNSLIPSSHGPGIQRTPLDD